MAIDTLDSALDLCKTMSSKGIGAGRQDCNLRALIAKMVADLRLNRKKADPKIVQPQLNSTKS